MYAKQEGLGSLGFFGTCRESFKIISSCKKIFLQITLTLILLLSIIFFWRIRISTLLTTKKISELDENFNVLFLHYTKYWVIEAAHFGFLAIFSLLSTPSVVYVVACVYYHNHTTYKMVMDFIPKVWNTLMITMISTLVIFIAYNILAFLTLAIFLSRFSENDVKLAKMVLSTTYILYYIGLVYICAIWQIASMICVLEGSYGFQAIVKSKALVTSNMGISVVIFLELNILLGGANILFEDSVDVVWKIGVGGFILMLRFLLFLFGLVVQSVTYFACESRVHDFSLSNHFDVHLGGYVPLDPKDDVSMP